MAFRRRREVSEDDLEIRVSHLPDAVASSENKLFFEFRMLYQHRAPHNPFIGIIIAHREPAHRLSQRHCTVLFFSGRGSSNATTLLQKVAHDRRLMTASQRDRFSSIRHNFSGKKSGITKGVFQGFPLFPKGVREAF